MGKIWIILNPRDTVEVYKPRYSGVAVRMPIGKREPHFPIANC